jgi:Uma2 family endonuclease
MRYTDSHAPRRRISVEEYLALEEKSAVRHEYVAGEMYEMHGATTRHSTITLNIVRGLHDPARKRGCRVFASDVKLQAASDRYYYPDVILACGKAAEVKEIVEEPTLVVEVASPSTRATDRREKLDAYHRMPTLRMYLIVEQRRRHVIVYTRDFDGEWLRDELQGNGDIAVSMLDARVTLDEIYEDVTMPPLAVREGLAWEESDDEGEEFDPQ